MKGIRQLISLLSLVTLSPAAPIITAGLSLTETTWNQVDDGIWLVEHYSPYCGHCKSFAPTWATLLTTYTPSASQHNFHFAQVDCVTSGDLCNKNGVQYYPSIFLYRAGVKEEEYKGKRDLESLGKWVEEKWERGEVAEEGGLVEDEEEEEGRLKMVDDEEGSSTIPFTELLTPSSTADLLPQQQPVKPQRQLPPAPKPPVVKQVKPVKPGPPVGFVKQPFSGEEKRGQEIVEVEANGLVNLLTVEDVKALRDGEKTGPAFVKFYAPWCTHCKALAPIWETLAEELKGQVAVYEVDCEGSASGACKLEKVKSYPTLFFYNDGVKVEYKQKRSIEAMKGFAVKAASATSIKSLANEYELKRVTSTDDVVFLFLHPADASPEDITLAKDASTTLLGGPSFFTSTSPDLFLLFALPSHPTLLVFKEHSPTPSSTFPLPPSSLPPSTRLSLTNDWIRVAKLSLLTELSGSTFYDLMPATFSGGEPPLVALAVLSPKRLGEGFERKKAEVESMARGWKARKGEGREVLWSWIDGDRWAGWAKSLYDVRASGDPVLVVADAKAMEYWKNGLDGQPLGIGGSGSSEEAYKLIDEGIFGGVVKPESSRNYVERIGDRVSKSSRAIFYGVINHPIMTLLALGVGSGAGVLVIRWLNSPLLGTPVGSALYTKSRYE